MAFELFLAFRYTRARKRGQGRNGFISFISLVSMLGIALGVAALIVVMSVMNGFQRELRERILGVVSHVQITGVNNDLAPWREIMAQSLQHPEVRAAAPFINAQGLLSQDDIVRGTALRGILPADEEKVAEFNRHMLAGRLQDLQPGAYGVVLGSDLAKALQVKMGDKLTLIAPQGMAGQEASSPRMKQLQVVGLFDLGMFEYDSGLALMHLEDAQKIYKMDDKVSGVRIKVADLFQARRVMVELSSRISIPAYISDWSRSHANYFRAVQSQKEMIFLILLLIIAVAAFNIVATLVMVVTDKQADIAILRTLGASPGAIMRIFLVQGSVIGMVGLGVGVLGGVVLALNVDVVVPAIEHLFGIHFLSKEVYHISELPSELRWSDVGSIVGVAVMLIVLSSLYPSWRAARTQPAAALSYE